MSIEAADSTVRVAAAQFYSGPDVAANLDIIRGYLSSASADGAKLIVLPENANRVRDFTTREGAWDACETLDGQFVTAVREMAREYEIMVALGVDIRGEQAPDVRITQLLIDIDGELLHVHHKTVFWDYEYTLFVPGTKQLEVVPTRFGRIGMLSCADGIVPEVPRILALKGADILVNSLNSRGPDEMRVHEPLRAIENHVWHIAANTVSGPANAYPWTGGSQIVSPTGEVFANAGESAAGYVVADITPGSSSPKVLGTIGSLEAFRRPDLYADLLAPTDELPVAPWYGPVDPDAEALPLDVVTLQLSWHHSTEWTLARATGQIEYAAARGAQLGVFPELFIHERGEVAADPSAAADLSALALERVRAAAAAAGMWVVVNLVERDGDAFHSTAFLIDADGEVFARYRKAHLNESERQWATAGDEFVVAQTPLGSIGLMIGDEVWIPEVARILALRGAEVIAHPADWDRIEAATMAATERTEENRTHLVSCARMDNPAGFGSQILVADRFRPGQPIALMRYPTAIWSRTGFEENIFYSLDRMDARSKVMGHHLDPLASRQPHLYAAFTAPLAAG